MDSANYGKRYYVTPLTRWAYTQNDPCWIIFHLHEQMILSPISNTHTNLKGTAEIYLFTYVGLTIKILLLTFVFPKLQISMKNHWLLQQHDPYLYSWYKCKEADSQDQHLQHEVLEDIPAFLPQACNTMGNPRKY